MKLLTLNTHSLVEENYPQKLSEFVNAVAQLSPEIIALQEVNQSAEKRPVYGDISGYVPCGENIAIREDNHIYRVTEHLRKMGIEYYWTWLPLKKGYDRFDEGIAVMSRSPILQTDVVQISRVDDVTNWKTRKLVGIRTETLPDEWFFSVHYGWWDDAEEPFREQWIRTAKYMTRYDSVWLMGDFNAPAEVRGESYDLMTRSYWQDTYTLAERKDSGKTVDKSIDGWRDKLCSPEGMRLDQIWCSKRNVITSSEVVFNGISQPVISDHYGVLVNYERSIV